MSRSIAFKCTYCDGDEVDFVGFADTCSDNTIKYNIKNGHVWCGSQNCDCRKYYQNGRNGKRPVAPCYESVLFKNWQYSSGVYQKGDKAGDCIPMTGTEKGRIAVLTTRFPGENESMRRIIGFFQIGRIDVDYTVYAKTDVRVRLPLEEAKELFFWAYTTTAINRPKWGSGLFRYLEDGQMHRILVDLADTVREDKCREVILRLIANIYGSTQAPLASGCLSRKSIMRRDAINKTRKYGPWGEGVAHKELKEWIAKNPEVLGILDIAHVAIERPYISGDVADIVFTHKDGTWTVVEIETNYPLPGVYQAIKYKTLLCAEQGLPLNSGKVRAFIVAWYISSELKRLCSNYSINYCEHKLH